MIKINLVREGRAAVRGATAAPSAAAGAAGNYNGILIVGLALLGLVAGGGFYLYKQNLLKQMKAEVSARRDEAQKLEGIIKEVESFQRRKDSLEKRIALINDLKRNQKNPVKIMDRVSQDLPDLVWLDSLSLEGRALKIKGRALNPNAVSNFISNIKADPLFEEPSFNTLAQQSGTGNVVVYSYEMSVNLKAPPVEPEGAAGADGKTGTGAAGTDTKSKGA